MITTNPFARLNEVFPDIFTPGLMRTYIIFMILLVIGGTLFDIWHKKSARYFFENTKRGKKNATRELGSVERKSLLVKTIASEVLTSSEFSSQKRRISHLLTMYGFILFVLTTAIMIFAYPTAADNTPGILPLLWHLGALSLCVGGYWFWFDIRVDVAAEGKPWYKIAPRADMFILSLLATCTFALLWSLTGVLLFFALFIFSSTILFGGVIWSKFAHMFFKPAAAYERRVVWAEGSREGLPDIPDLSSAEVHEKFPDIPTYLGKKPPDMGAGIRREPARHY